MNTLKNHTLLAAAVSALAENGGFLITFRP